MVFETRANTAGVFKGFYKNRDTQIGQFGGSGSDAPFLLISFNNEGFISPAEMRAALNELGSVDVLETQYNAFRGSRNFNNRSIHVTEQLFLVERR